MATSEDADDISSISWPGFVDIMSSVIMMFIFFVLITSVALYFHTITYKSKIMAQIAGMTQKSVEQQTQQIVKENAQVKQQLKEIIEENKQLGSKISELEDATKKSDSKFAESKEQEVVVNAKDGKIVLYFGQDSISLTAETKTKYSAFVDEFMKTVKDPARVYVDIEASKEVINENESFAQEVATARLMNSRNIILKTPIPKDHVSINIVPSNPIDGKTDWATVHMYEK
jgi:regulator of replication initiation timing